MNHNIKATMFKMLNARYWALRGVLAQMEDMLLSCPVTDLQDKENRAKLAREIWDRDYVVHQMRNEQARTIIIDHICEHHSEGK